MYVFGSVLIVSVISLIGVATLALNVKKLRSFLVYMISFSAGAMLGDSFLHLLPEVTEEFGFSLTVSASVLGGIVVFFVLEKIIYWQHCHEPVGEDHIHTFAYMNLVGDGVHNFIDGMIIAASYLINVPAGIATTIAVLLHEIPQEIGDFGVLIHGGFSRAKALMVNFASALVAFIGAGSVLWLNSSIEHIADILVPFAVGAFIYIAGSDLIPELHKEKTFMKSILQIVAFLAGIGAMALLLLLE